MDAERQHELPALEESLAGFPPRVLLVFQHHVECTSWILTCLRGFLASGHSGMGWGKDTVAYGKRAKPVNVVPRLELYPRWVPIIPSHPGQVNFSFGHLSNWDSSLCLRTVGRNRIAGANVQTRHQRKKHLHPTQKDPTAGIKPRRWRPLHHRVLIQFLWDVPWLTAEIMLNMCGKLQVVSCTTLSSLHYQWKHWGHK